MNEATIDIEVVQIALVPCLGVPAEIVSEIDASLVARGLQTTTKPGPGTRMVILVLPDDERAGPATALPSIAPEYQPLVVPLVIGDGPSRLLDDQSQIIVPLGAIAEAADILSSLAKLSGGELVQVNAMNAAATYWESHGRPDSALLTGPETSGAATAAAAAAAADHPDVELMNAFVRASLQSSQRTTRIRRLILTGTCLVLIAASVVALVQQSRANAAADESRIQANAALSNRLVQDVEAQLQHASDPDLTWLLAREALAVDPSPAAVRAALQVSTTTPQHRSIKLPAKPLDLTSSSRGTMAIRYVGGLVEVRDAEGKVLRTYLGTSELREVSISNDGTRIAIFDGDQIITNAAGDRQFPASEDVKTAMVPAATGRWSGVDLMLLTPSGLKVLGPNGEIRAAAVQPDPRIGTLGQLDITPNGSRLAVTGTNGVWVTDRNTAMSAAAILPSIARVVLTEDGKHVYVHRLRSGAVEVLDVRDDGQLQESGGDPGGALQIYRAGPLVILRDSPGRLCAATPPAAVGARCFWAHQGIVVGVASLGLLGVATAGTDRYLRVWPTVSAGAYPVPQINGTSAGSFVAETDKNRLGRRSSLQCDGDTPCWEIGASTGTWASFDADLTSSEHRWLGDPEFFRVVQAEGGAFVGVRSVASGWAAVLKGPTNTADKDAKLEVLWQGQQAGTFTDGIDAVAPDGAEYVLATQRGMTTWTDLDVATRDRADDNAFPVGVVFGGPNGTATAYYSDGSALTMSTDTTFLSGALKAVAESPSGDTLWWVDGEGGVFSRTGGFSQSRGRLPTGFDTIAIRPSPDGHYVAAFAPRETIIIRTSDSVPVFDWVATSEMDSVQDVAFRGPRSVLTVDHSGALRLVELTDTDSLIRSFQELLPRSLSPEERNLFDLPVQGD